MAGYTKLFSSIVTSTVWREPKETKIMWITMLALVTKGGIVEGSVPGMAAMAGLTIEEAHKAIEHLKSPDQWSRTKDNEGRRIQEVPGGWLLLNHAKYRAMLSIEERREYLTRKKAEERARKKAEVAPAVKAPAQTDEEWLAEVAGMEPYRDLAVYSEFKKAGAWCEVNKKQLTRKRFINWLNRIEKPMAGQASLPLEPRPLSPLQAKMHAATQNP